MKTENQNSILFYLESFLISFFSAFLIWLQTSKYGIGLDFDFYPLMAQEISDKGLNSVLYSTQVVFAPLYQFTLACLSKISGSEIIIVARWFNIFLMFLFSFLSMILCRKLTRNLAILFALGLFITFSRPINLFFCHAVSEPLFILFLLIITLSVEQTTYKRLILSGFLTSLAILTRYAGVAIVPSVCLYIFIQKSEISEKIKKCFCYATFPTLIYISYIVRNYYFTGTLMGSRDASNTSFISNCDKAISTVAFWFSASFSFLAIILALFLGAFIWNYRQELLKFFMNIHGTIKFSFCFLVVYSFFIIISTTTTSLASLDDRFMIPVFLPALLIVFSLIVFAHSLPNKNKTLVCSLFLIFLICSLGTFAKAVTKDINVRINNGAGGANSTFWRENELTKYAANNIRPDEYIFANNLLIQYILPEQKFISYIPQKICAETSKKPTGITLENLIERYPHFENSYILWFAKGYPKIFFSINELQRVCTIEPILDYPESGTVFRVGKCKK